MTYIALFRDPAVSVSTDQLVLDEQEMEPVNDALELLSRASQYLKETEEQLAIAKQKGHEEGFAEGKAEGLEAANQEVANHLIEISASAHQQRLALQGSVARMAMQVVRKIAGEIGASEMVANIALTAATDIVPRASLKIRVHPDVIEAVKEHIASSQAMQLATALHIDVKADDSLQEFDCILQTDHGQVLAGLDDQLNRLEAVLNSKLANEVSQ